MPDERAAIPILPKYRRQRAALSCVASALWLFGGSAAAAPVYHIQPGDILELAIAGFPDGRQAVPVEQSGDAAFPMIGAIPVAGLTLEEVRPKVVDLIANQVYKVLSTTGNNLLRTIEPREVTLRVAQYRPVYLSGDLARTGEVPFRPGLTVRQAVSIAGGYDLLRSGTGSSLLDNLALRSQFDTLSISLFKEAARSWRVRVGLGETTSFDQSEFVSLPQATRDEILAIERDLLKVRTADYENQRKLLVAAISDAKQRVETLALQAKNEEEGARLDETELAKVQELANKGLAPASRVTDTRRAALISSSRALQTSVAAENAKRDANETIARLQKLEDTNRSELLRELEESQEKLHGLRVQLDSLRRRLVLTRESTANLLAQSRGNLRITIFRSSGGTDKLAADENTELLPGDVVEVSVKVPDEIGLRPPRASAAPG